MNALVQFIKDRLTERSTWQGLILLVTVFGVNISPEHQSVIATIGATTMGALWVFLKDHDAKHLIAGILDGLSGKFASAQEASK